MDGTGSSSRASSGRRRPRDGDGDEEGVGEGGVSKRTKGLPRKRYQNVLNALRDKVKHLSVRTRTVGQMAASYTTENTLLRRENARVAAENYAMRLRIMQLSEMVLVDVPYGSSAIARADDVRRRMISARPFPFCHPVPYMPTYLEPGDRRAMGPMSIPIGLGFGYEAPVVVPQSSQL